MNFKNKKLIAVDIETIANKDVINLLPEPKPAGNLKDPVKIQADIEVKRQSQINKMGLSAWTGRICYFGAAYRDNDGTMIKNGIALSSESNESESDLIKKITANISKLEVKHGQLLFTTFNGNDFDIPFFKGRCLSLQQKDELKISTAKYSISNHLDVKAVLSNYKPYEPGTLDFFSQLLLGKTKTEGLDGSMVQGMWDNGEIVAIGEYCKDDCGLTLELAEMVLEYYL
jgi:DNA polymerase elongation subunit (family B)